MFLPSHQSRIILVILALQCQRSQFILAFRTCCLPHLLSPPCQVRASGRHRLSCLPASTWDSDEWMLDKPPGFPGLGFLQFVRLDDAFCSPGLGRPQSSGQGLLLSVQFRAWRCGCQCSGWRQLTPWQGVLGGQKLCLGPGPALLQAVGVTLGTLASLFMSVFSSVEQQQQQQQPVGTPLLLQRLGFVALVIVYSNGVRLHWCYFL